MVHTIHNSWGGMGNGGGHYDDAASSTSSHVDGVEMMETHPTSSKTLTRMRSRAGMDAMARDLCIRSLSKGGTIPNGMMRKLIRDRAFNYKSVHDSIVNMRKMEYVQEMANRKRMRKSVVAEYYGEDSLFEGEEEDI